MTMPSFIFGLFAAFMPECPNEESNLCVWHEPLTITGEGPAADLARMEAARAKGARIAARVRQAAADLKGGL